MASILRLEGSSQSCGRLPSILLCAILKTSRSGGRNQPWGGMDPSMPRFSRLLQGKPSKHWSENSKYEAKISQQLPALGQGGPLNAQVLQVAARCRKVQKTGTYFIALQFSGSSLYNHSLVFSTGHKRPLPTCHPIPATQTLVTSSSHFSHLVVAAAGDALPGAGFAANPAGQHGGSIVQAVLERDQYFSVGHVTRGRLLWRDRSHDYTGWLLLTGGQYLHRLSRVEVPWSCGHLQYPRYPW